MPSSVTAGKVAGGVSEQLSGAPTTSPDSGWQTPLLAQSDVCEHAGNMLTSVLVQMHRSVGVPSTSTVVQVPLPPAQGESRGEHGSAQYPDA